MAKLNWKTPNGNSGNVDIDKIFTTDGGTINGNIKFTSEDGNNIYLTDNSHGLTIGGGDDYDNGATIVLTGKDSSDAGIMGLHTHDGTNHGFIGIYTDKIRANQPRLSLGANANKYNIWIPSEVQPSNSDALAELKIMASPIQGSGDNWDSTPGAKLSLHTCDTSLTDKGTFHILASDGTNYAQLQGTPNGDLTWPSRILANEFIVASSLHSEGRGGFVSKTENGLRVIAGEGFGTSTGGGCIDLAGRQHGGSVNIMANGSVQKILTVTSNGMGYDGKYIITNGVTGLHARGMQNGQYTTPSIGAKSSGSGTITFPVDFGGQPRVVAMLGNGVTEACLSVTAFTKSSFNYAVTNLSTSAKVFYIHWIAIY